MAILFINRNGVNIWSTMIILRLGWCILVFYYLEQLCMTRFQFHTGNDVQLPNLLTRYITCADIADKL
jgi:hypothetical protein